MSKMKIAIIGAGWSGLACAQKLVELIPNVELSVFESAPSAGGRAKGLDWKLKDGEITNIDNGQHFIIGAYKNTFELLKKNNVPKWDTNSFTWNFSQIGDDLKYSNQIIFEIKRFYSYFFLNKKKWPRYWYFFLLLSFLLAKKNRSKIKGSAKKWLSKSLQPKKLQYVFWRPFIESTTNTNWNEASAKSLVTILLECSYDFPNSIKIYHPKNNLSKNGLDYIVKNLQSNGVKFYFGNTVTSLSFDGEKINCINNKDIIFRKFDQIVLALPTFASKKIWDKSYLDQTFETKNWENQETRGINTLWIALPKNYERLEKGSYENYWEINQLSKKHDESFLVIIERPVSQHRPIISVVLSAIDFNIEHIQVQNFEKMKIASNTYLKRMFGLTLEDCEYKFISEKRATFACLNGLSDENKLWGAINTGRKGIWRCSDDCINGFPSTIESAVTSGFQVANSIFTKDIQEHR